MPDETRLKRLRYRAAHRGTKENDLLLGGFAEAHLDRLPEERVDEFERLLDQPDDLIYAWIVGREPTPPEHATPLLDLIKGFRFFARTQWTPSKE